MVNLETRIGAVTLSNPVMPGSGTFGEGMAQVIDISKLGGVVTKTITQDIREGNPPPRVAELRESTLFSIGIPSKGLDHYINETVPFYRQYNVPLIASISADTVEDFHELAAGISVPGITAIEINVSCPNLKKDGEAFGMSAQSTYEVTKAVKAATNIPAWTKLTPNAANIAEVAQAAEEAGADALIVANAILGMAIDTETLMPRVANLMGGLTGNACKPINLRMAYQCVQAVDIPVIGCGGISTTEDALEYLIAGCKAIQVGTANFISPNSMLTIIQGLKDYCLRHNYKDINEVVGALQPYAERRAEATAVV